MTPVTLADLAHSMTGLRGSLKLLWDEQQHLWEAIEEIQTLLSQAIYNKEVETD